ncbi:MAG: DUF6703 family protein [Nocardioidaceae bacterium]
MNRRSYALLARLHRMPRWVVPAATVLLVLAGLYAGPVLGGLCLLLVAVFLLWLAYLAWPQLGRGARLVRLLMLAIVTGVAVTRILGAWG